MEDVPSKFNFKQTTDNFLVQMWTVKFLGDVALTLYSSLNHALCHVTPKFLPLKRRSVFPLLTLGSAM